MWCLLGELAPTASLSEARTRFYRRAPHRGDGAREVSRRRGAALVVGVTNAKSRAQGTIDFFYLADNNSPAF